MLTFVIGELPILALQQKRPEVDIGDVDRRVGRSDRHGGQMRGNGDGKGRETVRRIYRIAYKERLKEERRRGEEGKSNRERKE